MITKIFPDEYHLHTLDQMLSAIARLNPHVDMKKIVIGLMDRLSTFAQRETEADTAEQKQEAEEAATVRLMEKMRISKDSKTEAAGSEEESTSSALRTNGTKTEETSKDASESTVSDASTAVNGVGTSKLSPSGSVAEVRLYEIFYDQVINLVKTRGLSIQDTMALLNSLVNLAL